MGSQQRSEPKVFLSNERTLINWLHQTVLLGSVSAGMLGVSTHAHHHWGEDYSTSAKLVRAAALSGLGLAIVMTAYAAKTFYVRHKKIRRKEDGPYDDLLGPVAMSVIFIVGMFLALGYTAYRFFESRL
ncbi:unnamed protein product [Pedinophyceae sp. YPF-701]|nr:unnamed protein product [Pedinophyceae sp. YPF-701]